MKINRSNFIRLLMTVTLLSGAVCVGLWLADNDLMTACSAEISNQGQIKISGSSTTPYVDKKSEVLPPMVQDEYSSLYRSAENLLTQFESTADRKWLQEAQRLFPNDPQVILFSAVFAADVNDEWLRRLEDMEPSNGLPNLIRASLYATQGQTEKFQAELLKALSKEKWDTRSRQRMSAKLDAIIQSGQLPRSLILSHLDLAYFGKVIEMVKVMSQTPTLAGNQEEGDRLSLAVAQRIREQSSSFNMTSTAAGHRVELEILRKYDDGDLYGNEGMTILDRKNQIEEFGNWYHTKVLPSVYQQLVNNPSSNPTLSMQFFARIRADGEMTAVRWLLNQK
jgi:hypothetical protein